MMANFNQTGQKVGVQINEDNDRALELLASINASFDRFSKYGPEIKFLQEAREWQAEYAAFLVDNGPD